MHAAGNRGKQGKRPLRLDGCDKKGRPAAQPVRDLLCRPVRGLTKLLQKADLLLPRHLHGVYHILPAGQGAAEQTVSLLHGVPAIHFQLPAGHAVAGAGGQSLGLQKRLRIQRAVLHKAHHVQRGQIAQAMAVQKDLPAGIAAAEIGPALRPRLLVDPSWLSGIAHLLQVPVQLFPCGLMAVINGIVAHLPVGDIFVDLPSAVYLAVQMALGLDAGLVVRVDQADLRGAAHAAGNHVFPDDVGDVQKIDGL